MAKFVRKFRYAIVSVAVFCICCSRIAWTSAVAAPKVVAPAPASVQREDHAQMPILPQFENAIVDVFNGKKSAVARVVCVSKFPETSADEVSSNQVIAGSGFFVSDRAHVLTSASIVKNAHMIWIDYMGASYSAECIGSDAHTNVAVLRLLRPPSEFGIVDVSEDNQRSLASIGSFVVFVGCKLGMDPSPELGNISGKNISYSDNMFLTTYLRTNLPFCGGESGAPVFDLRGNLVGMMIASLPEMSSSFVLPKRALSKVFGELVKNGSVKHANIGVEVQSEYRFNEGQEIVISKIISGSEAEKAGLQPGDVIKKIGTFPVHYREDLHNAIFFCGDGGVIDVAVERNGKRLSLPVKSEYIVD
ncbi:MAG: S1C family serine protease [Puniceicoccales bacterium]|jgi:serine protease Do|nr:S1C family serine protease [Puniceicoccales bacterium]